MENKQIEEMANIIALKAFEQAHIINGDDNLADIVATDLYDKGYRKADEVVEEMIECLADRGLLNVEVWGIADLKAELKKKYTEEGK